MSGAIIRTAWNSGPPTQSMSSHEEPRMTLDAHTPLSAPQYPLSAHNYVKCLMNFC